MLFRESQDTELKEGISDIDAIITAVVSLANNGGGKVYIGIRDDGKILGVHLGRNTIENLARDITKTTEPPILPKIAIEQIEGKTIIVIDVKESRIKPHFYKKIAYKRVGKANIQMDISELRQLILEQSHEYFDASPVDLSLSELDSGLFRSFLRICAASNRIKLGDRAGISESMEKLDAKKDGKTKLGFVLAFAKNPSLYLSHYGVKFAKISTDSFSIESLEKSTFYIHPIFKAIDEVSFEILNNLPKKIWLEGLKRIEEPVVPKLAVREFLTNALIHADYRIASTISVLLTPTYLEISNPGMLLGMKASDLYKKHRSVLRNPFLAKLFFLSGNIEQWGSGIENAIKELVKMGLGLPEFRSEGNFFSVRINFSKETTSRTRAILNALREHKKTSHELAAALHISGRTIRKELKHLTDTGIVKLEKKDRHVFYSV